MALAAKLITAGLLTATILLSLDRPWVGLSMAMTFIILTIVLDFWVYRALDGLFQRLRRRNLEARVSGDGLHDGLERLMGGVFERLTDAEGLEAEQVRSDLYRLRDFNDQLLKLGEMAQELSAALPYRETKVKVLGLAANLLCADLVILVSEEAGRLTLEGVTGCEEEEIDLECCGFYAQCPLKASIRSAIACREGDHTCGMLSRSMRSRLALPFTVEDGQKCALIAAAAGPGAFVNIDDLVLDNAVGQIRSALSAARKYDRIRREVVTDPLTNLYNRRFFEQRAREEISRSLRHQQPTSLLMLDVDHFKRINDRYGHQTGDRVLQTVAKFLQDSVRKTDICGRFGGEEFVLVLPSTPGRNAVYLANRLRSGIGDIMYTGLGVDQEVGVTVSGGVATCPRDATTYEELLHKADRALYAAKAAGRDTIVQAGIADPPYDPRRHDDEHADSLGFSGPGKAPAGSRDAPTTEARDADYWSASQLLRLQQRPDAERPAD